MMAEKIGITVVAYDEPEYLYITLSGLFRCSGIEECPVIIAFDGPLSFRLQLIYEGMRNVFPISDVIFHKTNVGIAQNLVAGVKIHFRNGVDRVLYIEADHLIRTDTLDFIRNTPQREFFMCIGSADAHTSHDYRAKGNVVRREDFDLLYNWAWNREYIGQVPVKRTEALDESYTGHDAAFNIFTRKFDKKTQFCDGSYLSHFGLFGLNYQRKDAPGKILDIERRMFSGDPESWLHNVVRIIEGQEFPHEPEELYQILRLRLWPSEFVYK